VRGGPRHPEIALTSHHDEVHRVRLLERGSDDVITKPFSYPELRARVQRVLRAQRRATRATSSPPGRCASTDADAP
jgi:DNA-binding response OmpR family regulator